MLEIIIALALATFIYYVLLIKPFTYWKSRGIIQPGLFQLWTENLRLILQQTSQAQIGKSTYDAIKGRYFGSYQFYMPVLYLKDADLIKDITVKDFDHFVDHKLLVPEDTEPLVGKVLSALKGDNWRDMRATLRPSFTSNKMKGMFSLMVECSEQFVRHFENGNGDTRTITVDFKDAFTKYANDVIASAAFGVNCNSLKYPQNEFYVMAKTMTNFSGFWKSIKFVFVVMFPRFFKLLGIKILSRNVEHFFRRLVKTNIESRERLGIVRPDMIHLLMEARKGKLKHETNSEIIDTGFAVIEESNLGKEEKRQKRELSDDDITAQALVFFVAGFDGVSISMCFTIYELAMNLDVQQKLVQEIDNVLKECNGALTYEALLKMKYMDMVLSEVLRKWPVSLGTNRLCIKPYTIQPLNDEEKPVHLNKGDVIWLPIYGLHRDAQYFPDPDRFDPERFSDENKCNIPPYAYIPFGSGPRSCIGSRFALLEVKTVMFYILSKFEINVVEKSLVPIKIAKNNINVTAEGGFWFGLKPRTAM